MKFQWLESMKTQQSAMDLVLRHMQGISPLSGVEKRAEQATN